MLVDTKGRWRDDNTCSGGEEESMVNWSNHGSGDLEQ